MGYYNISLTDASKKVRTVTTPFGKYEYNRLLMGECIAPDIFQEQMSALMGNLDFVKVYLNDLFVITSGSFKEHLSRVGEVMKKPQSAGLKFKIDKCKFAPKVE